MNKNTKKGTSGQAGSDSGNESGQGAYKDKWERLEAELLDLFDFRYNELTNSPEYREKGQATWEPATEYAVNSIVRKLQIDRGDLFASADKVDSRLCSDFAPKANPLKDYFSDQAKKSLQGAISAFCEAFTLEKPDDMDLFRTMARKWFIGVVANVFEEGCANHGVLVFTGDQGTGKSTAIARMIPPELKQYYYQGGIDPDNKDAKMTIARHVIINLDDYLDSLTAKKQSELKALITDGGGPIRLPYGKGFTVLPRVASFIACSNSQTFLHDQTGNRRFWPFAVQSIDLPALAAFDSAALWSEAARAYFAGEKYWIDGEEQTALALHNQDFEVQTMEYEALVAHFQKPDIGGVVEDLTNTEILRRLEMKGYTKLTTKKLGEALKKAGYEKRNRKRNGQVSQRYSIVQVDGVQNDPPEPLPAGEQDAPPEDAPF